MPRYCECGRPALARQRATNRSRNKGRPVRLEGHDLCGRCFRRALDSMIAHQKKERSEMNPNTKNPPRQQNGPTVVLLQGKPDTELAQNPKDMDAELSIAALDAIDRIDNAVAKYRADIEHSAMKDFKRAVVTALAIRQIRDAMTEPVIELLKSLMNSPLGFVTDHGPQAYRDDYKKPYDDETIKTCALEAVIKGVLWTGNHFNILAGRCYITKEGYYYLLSRLPGLTDLNVVPSVPVMREGNTVVRVAASWKKDGVASSLKDHEGKPGRNFPIVVNKSMGPDAIIGKAYRKAYKCIWDQIHGCESSEDDEALEIGATGAAQSATGELKDRLRQNLANASPQPTPLGDAAEIDAIGSPAGNGGALFDAGGAGDDPAR